MASWYSRLYHTYKAITISKQGESSTQGQSSNLYPVVIAHHLLYAFFGFEAAPFSYPTERVGTV